MTFLANYNRLYISILYKLLLTAIIAPHSLHFSLFSFFKLLIVLLKMQADGVDAGAVVVDRLPAIDDQGPVLRHHGVKAIVFLLDVVCAILVRAVKVAEKAARSREIELD